MGDYILRNSNPVVHLVIICLVVILGVTWLRLNPALLDSLLNRPETPSSSDVQLVPEDYSVPDSSDADAPSEISISAEEVGIGDDGIGDTGDIEIGNADEALLANPYFGVFELPLYGTSGYASVNMNVIDEFGQKAASLSAGDAFTILMQDGERFFVELTDGTTGYVETKYVMVNLPDLIPSIIYRDTNSRSSIFRSSGHSLPQVTGEKLYDVWFENPRFGEEQYVMPVLYTMAQKIMLAQQEAWKNGESLLLYESFRPLDVQKKVGGVLTELAAEYKEVNDGLNTPPWSQSWFIAMSLSNHQRGCAIDTSLVKVAGTETRQCGTYTYNVVTDYSEFEMPTAMHELSYAAATFVNPVSSKDDVAWRSAVLSPTMTEAAIRLQEYCTNSGLSPLASEWWHFNDLYARQETAANPSYGQYRLKECVSRPPQRN